MGNRVLEKFATTKAMMSGDGNTLTFNRQLRVAKKTTADTEGTMYGYTDGKALLSNSVSVTPTKYGDSFPFSEERNIDSFITDAANKETIADQITRSNEYLTMKVLAQGGIRHRIDNDGTYQFNVAVTTANSAGTSLISTSLTQIDDFWNGGYATIYNPNGPGYDETSAITDFTASSDTAAVTFSNGLTTDSKARLVVGTGIAASDKLTTSGILLVNALHRVFKTEPFTEGGRLRGVINAAQEYDLWSDTAWADTAKYDDSGRYRNYQLVRWLGIDFLITDEPYREDVDGTENQASGVVHVSPIFGAKAFSVVNWFPGGSGAYGIKWEYKDGPDSMDLRNAFNAISWKTRWGGIVTRATSVVNLLTGATDIGVNLAF